MTIANYSTPNGYYFSNYTGYVEDFNVHYYYTFVHPVATLVGSALNVVCAIVFAQRSLLASGPFFHYSLVNSVGATVALAAFSLFFLTRCGNFCSVANTYWSQLYELYAGLFFTNSLYFAGSLIQISISFQLYFSVTQKWVFKIILNWLYIYIWNIFLHISQDSNDWIAYRRPKWWWWFFWLVSQLAWASCLASSRRPFHKWSSRTAPYVHFTSTRIALTSPIRFSSTLHSLPQSYLTSCFSSYWLLLMFSYMSSCARSLSKRKI